jgi:S1-C subfamily serine protease
VKDGDYITGFDGRKIHNLSDIRVSLLYAQEGREYTLNVKRGDQALNLSTSF